MGSGPSEGPWEIQERCRTETSECGPWRELWVESLCLTLENMEYPLFIYLTRIYPVCTIGQVQYYVWNPFVSRYRYNPCLSGEFDERDRDRRTERER